MLSGQFPNLRRWALPDTSFEGRKLVVGARMVLAHQTLFELKEPRGIAAADLDVLGQPGENGSFPELDVLLRAISDDLRRLSDVITYYYFSHAEVRVS